MNRLPIRLRLTLVFALVMAVVFTATGVLLYVRLGSTLDGRINDGIDNRTSILAAAVRGASGGSDVDPALIAGDDGIVQIVGADGTIVVSSALARVSPLSEEELAAARQETITVEKELPTADSVEEFRVRAMPVDGRVVVVGDSLDDRDSALSGLLTQLLIVLPIALLLSSALGYVVAGAAFRPVEAMRRRAAEISTESADQRLPLPQANDEVYRLGATLNAMLARLDAGLARERRFVADASHELRTPLATLRTELELALRRPRSPDELEAALGSAGEEVERLVQLAEDLLVIARADEGRLFLRVERHDVRALLDAVAGRNDPRARDTGRALEVSAPEGVVLVADRMRLEQAVGNLVENALRHGAGTISVDARLESDRLVVSVTDEGEGFPQDFLPHAFERFSRADAARTGGAGVGLGLAIVEAIASAHGGTATATNHLGGGAEVTLSIPLEPAAHRGLI